MIDINSTAPILGPVSSTVQEVLNVVSLLVGGIFGIYVITLIVRLVFFKKIFDMYKQLKREVEKLNK